MEKSINLTCHGTESSCTVTKIGWTADGIIVNTTLEYILKDRLTSSVVVNGSSFEGQYTCTINYTGGSAAGVYVFTGWCVIFGKHVQNPVYC